MAIADHDHHLPHDVQPSDQRDLAPNAAQLPAKRERKLRSISNRISWILAAAMLGATAGWMIFQAFLTFITMD